MNSKEARTIGVDIANIFLDYINRDNIKQPFTKYSETIKINIDTNYQKDTDTRSISFDIVTYDEMHKLATVDSQQHITFYVSELAPNDLTAIDYLNTLIYLKFIGKQGI